MIDYYSIYMTLMYDDLTAYLSHILFMHINIYI